MRHLITTLAFGLTLFAAPAAAGTSDWFETTGGAVRLTVGKQPGAAGELRGALEIRLEPGWKTYWREPGESGVPPQLTLAEGSAEILFPAPRRFDDGSAQWAGYDHSVVLPVRLRTETTDQPIEAEVFLGVCETICVPVEASLTTGTDSGPLDLARIERAFATLPGAPADGFQVTGIDETDGRLVVAVDLPGDAPADLFLAGHDGLMLAAPRFEPRADGGVFTARILNRPKGGAIGADYTLVSGDAAVAGVLPPQ